MGAFTCVLYSQNMKKTSFSKALFSQVDWLPFGLENQEEIESAVEEKAISKPVEEISKSEALDSMKKFTNDVLGDGETEKAVLNDVEILREAPKAKYSLSQNADEALESLLSGHPERLEAIKNKKKVRLFFIVSEFIEREGSLSAGAEQVLEKEQAELFMKMIGAMKLDAEDIWMSAADNSELMHAELAYLDPEFVVTLGAVATHFLMKKKVRLSLVQGEFFSYLIEYKDQIRDYMFIPLFHPEYLLINPNMKRKTWNGMQKLMARL